MKKFAKYIDENTVEFLLEIPFVSNPTEETLKNYAIQNNYKPVIESKPANPLFYDKKYEEKNDKIIEKWVGKDLSFVKELVLDKIQSNLGEKITERTTLESKTLDFPIIYDLDAIINIVCILILNTYGMLPNGYEGFIDANDNIHSLQIEDVMKIAILLATHRISLYNKASVDRKSLKNSESVQEAENIFNNI